MLLGNFSGLEPEAGCDEAGRGALAGPVFAAAVVLPVDYRNEILNDSKQLSVKQRELLRSEIESAALAWAVASVGAPVIDRINILNASILAMHEAIRKLCRSPQYLLIDGNRFKPYAGIPYQCIVKGDARFLSIAAASILAKTHRDEYMVEIHGEFPCYGWDRNKGYPTAPHRKAIFDHGLSSYHRATFRVNKGIGTQMKCF